MRYLKIYENWFTDYFKQPEIPKQTQEELDKQLYDSIVENKDKNTFSALDALKKGANPNQVQDVGRGWEFTLLMIASSDGELDIVEELIKCGADVYYSAYQFKSKHSETEDYFDWVNQIVYIDYRSKIYAIIKKYHPDFDEERELRRDANKYNI